MSSPKIQSVQVVDDYTLLIEFDHHEKRRYDVRPLFQKEMFQPLRNPAFLKNVSVAAGGYALVWNEEIDLSEYELWSKGQAVIENPAKEWPLVPTSDENSM